MVSLTYEEFQKVVRLIGAEFAARLPVGVPLLVDDVIRDSSEGVAEDVWLDLSLGGVADG